MKSLSKPTDDLVDKALASVKTDVERHHFFTKLSNPKWLEPLFERGVFDDPPKNVFLGDGYVQFPFWPEFQFLKNVASEVQDTAIEVILSIPQTDNPRIYEDVIDVSLNVDPGLSIKLKDKIFEYTRSDLQFINPNFEKLLVYWSENDQIESALELAEQLVHFLPDPLAEEKQVLYRNDPRNWSSHLETKPRLESWAYQRFLKDGVQILSIKEPYKTAIILIRATAEMINFRFHVDQLDEVDDEDLSDIWCPRVNELVLKHEESDESLVHSLTICCEKVYERAPGRVEDLDRELRKQRWKIFGRIRQHLFSLHLNAETRPWIRELILDHADYSKWEHHFESQRMIRCACDFFGSDLLTIAERVSIYNEILNGPSKEGFKEWIGDRFTEEIFIERKRYFHKMQLAPFASILFGEYKDYFNQLVEKEENPIVDDDYAPYKPEEGKVVVSKSPMSHIELGKLPDEELLSYINKWDNVSRDLEDRWIETTFGALADEFQTTFKDTILPDESRFIYWINNKERIDRPIYVKAIVSAISEHTKSEGFELLDQSFDFCEWVLSNYQDSAMEQRDHSSHKSKEHPDWQSSRRAVGDFIGLCVKKDIDVPIDFRQRLFSLLKMLCTQYDRQLDDNEPVLLNKDEPLTEAINCTRSRALESIVDYGYWVRRQSENGNRGTPEVFEILDMRLDPKFRHSLTLPEYTLLGVHFVRIFGLNQEWSGQNSGSIFPQDQLHIWSKSFGFFLQFSRPYKPIFETVRNDLEFAIKNVGTFGNDKSSRWNFVDKLGEHLFLYYLWGLYSLQNNDSLLSRYYESTKNDKSHWSNLFDYVGRSLKNSGKQLEKRLEQRAIEFFDWRFEEREPFELKQYAFWLEAECLDMEWRLKMLSKILDICNAQDIKIYTKLSVLRKMLNESTALVVECFAKLTDLDFSSQRNDFISSEEVKPILQIGLESDDSAVRENAERARENLLRLGNFDLWES